MPDTLKDHGGHHICDRFRGFLPVIIDVETGGFIASTDAVLEIAATIVRMDEEEVEALVGNMVLLLNHWLTYDHLLHDDRPPAHIIHQGVYQLMSMLAPYLGETHREFYQQVRDIYHTIVVPTGTDLD